MKKTRLQFDASPEMLAQYEHIMHNTGAATRAEVHRRAIRLLDDATKGNSTLRDLAEDGTVRRVTIL